METKTFGTAEVSPCRSDLVSYLNQSVSWTLSIRVIESAVACCWAAREKETIRFPHHSHCLGTVMGLGGSSWPGSMHVLAIW